MRDDLFQMMLDGMDELIGIESGAIDINEYDVDSIEPHYDKTATVEPVAVGAN